MIIQIKSSYSGPLSHNLEDGQELFISHSQVTHAYVQKKSDENAVARLYLSQGELHLVPMSRTENVFLQNRPFTEDTVLGNEYLLQIKESILLFEVDGEVVMIMMGLALGYGNTSGLKTVKVKELTPTTPSQAEETQPSNGALLRPAVQPPKAFEQKKHGDEPLKKADVKPSESEEESDVDILLSESSTTTVGEMLKSVPKMEEHPKSGNVKWVAIVACMMIVMCAATWSIARRDHVKTQMLEQPVAGKNEVAMVEHGDKSSMDGGHDITEEKTGGQATIPTAETTVKTEKTNIVAGQVAATKNGLSGAGRADVAAVTAVEQKTQEPQTERAKPAVTLEERLALAKKELEDLTQDSNVGDIPIEFLESDRLGQDIEWTKAMFDKLKVSLRKVQIQELEKQMALYQRAKNLDVSKFSEEATADFQKRFKEYTAQKGDWGYNYKDIEFSRELIRDLQKGQVNPNLEVVDSNYKVYSGPMLFCLLSGRIQLADEIARELLKLGANPDVCFSNKERFFKEDVYRHL